VVRRNGPGCRGNSTCDRVPVARSQAATDGIASPSPHVPVLPSEIGILSQTGQVLPRITAMLCRRRHRAECQKGLNSPLPSLVFLTHFVASVTTSSKLLAPPIRHVTVSSTRTLCARMNSRKAIPTCSCPLGDTRESRNSEGKGSGPAQIHDPKSSTTSEETPECF